jgi:hypothetical protein
VNPSTARNCKQNDGLTPIPDGADRLATGLEKRPGFDRHAAVAAKASIETTDFICQLIRPASSGVLGNAEGRWNQSPEAWPYDLVHHSVAEPF